MPGELWLSPGGALIGLAALFIAIDAYDIAAALVSHTPVDFQAQVPWIIDFIIECPALLIGGILLWRGTAPGYATGAALLFQIGALTAGVPVSFALGAILTGSPFDGSTAMLLAIGIIPLALLWPFLRGKPLRGRPPLPVVQE